MDTYTNRAVALPAHQYKQVWVLRSFLNWTIQLRQRAGIRQQWIYALHQLTAGWHTQSHSANMMRHHTKAQNINCQWIKAPYAFGASLQKVCRLKWRHNQRKTPAGGECLQQITQVANISLSKDVSCLFWQGKWRILEKWKLARVENLRIQNFRIVQTIWTSQHRHRVSGGSTHILNRQKVTFSNVDQQQRNIKKLWKRQHSALASWDYTHVLVLHELRHYDKQMCSNP